MLHLRKQLQPLRRPFLRAVRPGARPLAHTPRISHNDKPFVVDFDCPKDGVCVTSVKTLYLRGLTPIIIFWCIERIEGAGKDTVLVNLAKLLFPELIGVEDVL